MNERERGVGAVLLGIADVESVAGGKWSLYLGWLFFVSYAMCFAFMIIVTGWRSTSDDGVFVSTFFAPPAPPEHI